MDDAGIVSKLLDWFWGVVLVYTGYLHMNISDQRKDLTALQLKIAENYVTSAEHNKAIDRVDAKLDLILEKLDKKVDKH